MKKLLYSVLLFSLTIMLVACGATKEDDVPKGVEAQDNSTELVFWHSMDTTFGELVNQQVENFNNGVGAEKNIKVKAVFQNYPGTEALTAAMSSDDIANMPDVIQIYGESVSLLRDYKRTAWAEDHITKDSSTLKKADLIPNTVSSFSIEDRLIGVPYNIAAWMLYYNKEHLEAAGYQNPPKTIAEMAEMLPNLVEKTDAEHGLNVRINQYELVNFIAAQGAEFGNNDSGHSGHMTEFAAGSNGSLLAFLTEWEKVVKSGAYKPEQESINEEFAFGLNSMVIMASSRIPTVKGLVGDKFAWDVAPVPTVSESDLGGSFPTGGGLFMLNRDDEKKVEAAWEFVQYLASAEAQALWLEGTGYIPVNVGAPETETFQAKVQEEPKLKAPYDLLLNSSEKLVVAYTPNFREIDNVIADTMLKFAQEQLTPQEANDTMYEGISRVIGEYYRVNPID